MKKITAVILSAAVLLVGLVACWFMELFHNITHDGLVDVAYSVERDVAGILTALESENKRLSPDSGHQILNISSENDVVATNGGSLIGWTDVDSAIEFKDRLENTISQSGKWTTSVSIYNGSVMGIVCINSRNGDSAFLADFWDIDTGKLKDGVIKNEKIADGALKGVTVGVKLLY